VNAPSLPGPPTGTRRVLIVTASMGGGHDGPARELARRLTTLGVDADVVDLVGIAPYGTGRLLRSLFRVQLTWAPGSWGRWFDGLDRPGRALPAGLRVLIARFVGRINALLAADGARPAADLAISTFPLGGHILAAARRTGPAVPTVTYITDPAVHRAWVADGTDCYLTTWRESARSLTELLNQITGRPPAVVHSVFPAVRPEFRFVAPGSAGDVRRALGLPAGRLALVSSGSWGVGAVLRSTVDIARNTDLIPVVVCGRNERLRRRVARVPGVVALGWVDDMAGLMRSCEVAVVNSGGLTLAEAAVCGLPVVHYCPLPGQGVANALFGAATGWSPHCVDAARLDSSIRAACATAAPPLPAGDPVTAILELLPPRRDRFPLAG
jgi:UDP-N-acetylglucosamine:LPS N-acetylglucosamine transferase